MHDAHNFPQFNTLKTIWNAVAPQLLAAFDLLVTKKSTYVQSLNDEHMLIFI